MTFNQKPIKLCCLIDETTSGMKNGTSSARLMPSSMQHKRFLFTSVFTHKERERWRKTHTKAIRGNPKISFQPGILIHQLLFRKYLNRFRECQIVHDYIHSEYGSIAYANINGIVSTIHSGYIYCFDVKPVCNKALLACENRFLNGK